MSSTPYLSVVVTTGHDDDGDGRSDPLGRLQLFVSCLNEQCRQTGLDAEVIVVDRRRPPQRTSAGEALRLPDPCFCTYRFIDVPPDVCDRLRHADALPALSTIAMNAGVRRARGRFILTTSADVIFSTELIAYLASRPLKPGHLYRVDCHDVEPDVPSDAPLEAKLAYCATHQTRVHARWGSYPVDRNGSTVCLDDDIVDGRAVRLGDGWHVREGDPGTAFFRWAGDRAEVIVETAAGATTAQVLEIDVEANPYDPRAWVRLEALEGERAVARAHVTGRMQLHVPLERVDRDGPRRIALRVTETHAKPRLHLPVFERRDQLSYRVYSVRLRPVAAAGSMVEYPLAGWTNANPTSAQTLTPSAEGLVVATDPLKWSYSMHYGMLQAPAGGTYRFDLSCSVLEGRVHVGVLNGARDSWIPASVSVQNEANGVRFGISVDLGRNEPFWLMICNYHPDGAGVTRFIVREMTGSINPAQFASARESALRANASIGWILAAAGKMTARVRPFFAKAFSLRMWRERTSAFADSSARIIVTRLPERLRGRIVRAAPEYRAANKAFHIAAQEVKTLAPLRDLAGLHKSLRERRPDNLHVNACDAFQLADRDHWDELRGYPELEAIRENVYGLFSFIADVDGIEEQVLQMPIYRLERAGSSFFHDEGARTSQAAITRLGADTVSVWASQMRWLRRPMIFNGADWGLGRLELPERTVVPVSNTVALDRAR